MMKKVITMAITLSACGVEEHQKPTPPDISGVWHTQDCDGQFETIKFHKDGTFEIKTNKNNLTKNLNGAYEVTDNKIKFIYSSSENYENNFDFTGKTLNIYRGKIYTFIKVPDEFERPTYHVTNNNYNTNNNQVDVKPQIQITCEGCCKGETVPPQNQQQIPPRRFPFPC